MNRLLATTLFLAIATPWATSARALEPIDVGSRRELLVDRFLIDSLAGAELRLQRPVDRGPVLAFDEPWEGPFSGYATVIHADGKYMAFYRGTGSKGARKDSDPAQVVCLAVSLDGVHWTKPALDLFPREGRPTTNIVLADAGAAAHNFAPFLDARPGVDPDARYKAVGGVEPKGLFAFASPDGIHWRRLRDVPVFTKKDAQVRPGGDAYVFDSQNVPFWSEAERKYLLYYRVYEDGKRRIARAESDDFLTWKNPALMEYRRGDGSPAAVEQLYTSQTHPYFRAPHLSVATAARFVPGRRAITEEQARAIGVDPGYFHDVSDAVLLTSRGGAVYDRTFMEALVAPGVGPENWTSRTNYPARNVVPTGPAEMSLYVNQNYGQPSAHLRRYGLRLDGFAAVHAGYDGGAMTTKPLTFQGSRLLLNFATSAVGGVRVEIQDPDGAPIPGFALADCEELVGNEIERAVVFKGGGLNALAGRPVRLRFVMKDADLFALRFAPAGGEEPPAGVSVKAFAVKETFDLSEPVVLKVAVQNNGPAAVGMRADAVYLGLPFSVRVRRSDGRGGFLDCRTRPNLADPRYPIVGSGKGRLSPFVLTNFTAGGSEDHEVALNLFRDLTLPGEYEAVVDFPYWPATSRSTSTWQWVMRPGSRAFSPPIRFVVAPKLAPTEPPGAEAAVGRGGDETLEIEAKTNAKAEEGKPLAVLVTLHNKSGRPVRLVVGRLPGEPLAIMDVWRWEDSKQGARNRERAEPMDFAAPTDADGEGRELPPGGRLDFVLHADLHADIRYPFNPVRDRYSIEVAVPYRSPEGPPGERRVRAEAMNVTIIPPWRAESLLDGHGIGGGGFGRP